MRDGKARKQRTFYYDADQYSFEKSAGEERMLERRNIAAAIKIPPR